MNKTDCSKRTKRLVTLNANARSLAPKIESLADCFNELNADLALVTETWFQDRNLESTTIDTAGEHGLCTHTLNRPAIAGNGRQYGGVAIFSRSASSKFDIVELLNPESYEVLCVAGKITGIREKIVAVAVYIPPNYTRVKADFTSGSGWRLESMAARKCNR